ncbi:glycosyltransferase [Nocardia sp. BMG51109]|uniref:glycosyltransferase n=1 Tax=Nocardia sp. BMG51109 TaxID=1056816 RepID=UPI000466A1B4|nr:glycosyltransferase [Nocardia sp. BMG51109]
MNIVVLGQGTRGDLYPLLGMARALLARRHRVTVLEYDEYASDVEDAGLPFLPVGTGSQCAHVFENVPAGPATPSTEWTTDRLYFEASLRSARPFATALAGLRPRPDAIVSPALHIGAALGGELIGAPVTATFLGMSMPSAFDTRTASGMRARSEERRVRIVDRLVLPGIAAARRDLGLGAEPGEATFARVDRAGGLVLAAGPLATAPTALPRTFEIAGYPDYYGPRRWQLDEPTKRFLVDSGLPVVVCSLGDGWARALPEPLRRLVEHAGRGRYRLLVIGGRMPALETGPGARLVARADLREVLQYADVSVNHGGMGTLVAALRAAVPSVMTTQWPDGRRNAAALAAHGLGVDLGSAPAPEELLGAVDAAIGGHTMKARLRAARAAMRSERDPADALLDRLHRQREGRTNDAETGAGGGGSSR